MKATTSIVAVTAAMLALGAGGSSAKAGETAGTKGEVATASGLQNCDDVGRIDAVVGDSVTTTCEIKLTGLDEGSSFKVEMISGKVTEDGMPGEESAVRVTKMVGVEAGQVMEEMPVTLLVPAQYKDVNGDGEGDILITRDIGNVNAVDGVWLGSPDGAPFYRVGEVAGDFGEPTSDGFMTVSARSSADTQCISFYKVPERELLLAASACVTATESNADGVVTATTCALENTDGLAAFNLTEEAAKTKFCAEPAVVNAYK
jgi:hypothetical protein